MFKFRLQTVLDYRKRIEEDFQKELAEKKQILINETKILKDYEYDLLKHESLLNEEKKKESLNADFVKSYYMYFDWLYNKIELQKKKVSEVNEAFMEKREDLLTATKNKKMLELLSEKDRKQYVDEINKKEQVIIDEIVTIKYGRKILATQ